MFGFESLSREFRLDGSLILLFVELLSQLILKYERSALNVFKNGCHRAPHLCIEKKKCILSVVGE